MIGIGIDTGGTCTDAVIYDLEKKDILASAKSATTHEKLEIGIENSLRKLPATLVAEASYISLSTTLATNACVENKGGRVALIFIGVDKKTVDESYQKYGFESTDYMYFLDSDPMKKIAPDWEAFESLIPEIIAKYDSVAISQVTPRENDGAYEKEAAARIKAHADIPVVRAYEIFKDLNVIKRGAGALLNARLIPIIKEFFSAVHNVLDEMHISLPFLIMRSDGSLVSEEYSSKYPVETLLCGPTASAKGAVELMPQKNAVIIDMGGTTSDIALVKSGEPKIDLDGVRVGGWQTFVRGIDIDTFALGGDSHVLYENQKLYLEDQRVLPLSNLAGMCPSVLTELKRQSKREHGSTRPLYEHFLAVKSIEGKESHYTEQEVQICKALLPGPLGMVELAEHIGIDVYQLKTSRLEQEGIIIRSGLTPTDAMVLLGDFKEVENPEIAKEAISYATEFVARSTHRDASEIVPEIYRLVKEKLYCNLVRILWADAHGSGKVQIPRDLSLFAKEAFSSEYSALAEGKNAGENSAAFFKNTFSTDAVLLGAGAPTHVFLEDVAKALHTKGVVSKYSGVCNALGALLGDACVYETVHVRVEYVIGAFDNEAEKYFVYVDERECYDNFDDAEKRAAEIAMERAKERVIACGASEIYSLAYKTSKKEGVTNLGGILMSADITACARGHYRF